MTPYEEENIKKYYIPVDITDEDVIEHIVGTSNEKVHGGAFWLEVNANGKKYFAKKNITEDASDLIYEYIDSNPEIKKSLMVNTGMSYHVKADVILAYSNASVNANKSYMTTLTKRSEIKKLRNEFENSLLETPCKEIYAAKMDESFINDHWLVSDGDEFGDNNSKVYMNEIKYHDGMYYLSASEITYGSDEFRDLFNSFNDETTYLAVKEEKSTFYPVGSINLSDEQIINLESVLIKMPRALSQEFRELVINAIDYDIIYDNSVIFSIGHGNKTGYFILNYERDIEPLIEKYADYICGIIANKAVSTTYGCYQYGTMVVSNLAPSNQEAALAELRGNLPKIKELFLKKYSDENMPMELFRGYVNYWVDPYSDSQSESFIFDSSFTTMLDLYMAEKEKCEEVVEVRCYNHDLGRELSFTKDDGELFEILLHSILFARMENYGLGNEYYAKYKEEIVLNTNPDSAYISSDTKIVESAYYSYDYGNSFDATIIYADGNEEILYLRFTVPASIKLKQYGFFK